MTWWILSNGLYERSLSGFKCTGSRRNADSGLLDLFSCDLIYGWEQVMQAVSSILSVPLDFMWHLILSRLSTNLYFPFCYHSLLCLSRFHSSDCMIKNKKWSRLLQNLVLCDSWMKCKFFDLIYNQSLGSRSYNSIHSCTYGPKDPQLNLNKISSLCK